MAASFFAGLLQGSYTQPDSIINSGAGPLPSVPSWAPPQLQAPPDADGVINGTDELLQGVHPYAYGVNPARISTQTQVAHPNKVQLVIPPLFIPAAQSTAGCVQDPLLEHATTDGDLVFSLRMNPVMQGMGAQYCIMPYSTSTKTLKLINLATVNYLLWGLQVGTDLGDGRDWRWKAFFSNLCLGAQAPYEGGDYTAEVVWNFLQTYVAPFGVQHGSDRQGGMHEGGQHRISSVANQYVAAFAVEGKLHKVNNLWRCFDIDECDDLVLELTYMPPQAAFIPFSLSSSTRATRVENAPVPQGWWYLAPAVLRYKTIVDTPHIRVGRSQKMIAGYQGDKWGLGTPRWNARACAVGTPVVMTFEPDFVDSDDMLAQRLERGAVLGPGRSPTQRELAEVCKEPGVHITFKDIPAKQRMLQELEAKRKAEREAAKRREEAERARLAGAGGGGGFGGMRVPARTSGGPLTALLAADAPEGPKPKRARTSASASGAPRQPLAAGAAARAGADDAEDGAAGEV